MSDTPRTDAVYGASPTPYTRAAFILELCRELERELATENAINQRNCEDWAHDHTHLQNLCREVGFSEHDVEGDKYGIRAITQLGDMLRSKVAELERENARLRDAGHAMRHLQIAGKPCSFHAAIAMWDALCPSQTPTNDKQGA